MAYDIPVAVLLIDHQAAAALIGESSNYFDDDSNDRCDGVERLAKVTKAPINSFALEDGSVYHLGIYLDSDFCILIDAALASKAASTKNQYDHPLVQSAKLAVVSQFN